MRSKYKEYLKDSYDMWLRITVTRTNAEDASDILHNAIESFLSYDKEIKDLQKFFNRTLHNSIVDYYREKSKQKLYEEGYGDPALDEVTPERSLVSKEDMEEVAAIMMQMDNDVHREAIKLLLDGNSHREIADILDLTYSNVRKIVQRFRNLIK